jgi:thiol-disulfide isomerase/thioredoxin
MRPVTLRRPVLAIALLALAAASCREVGDAPTTEPAVPAVNATAASLLPTNAIALPDADLASYRRLLEQLAGTPVVVNFWGSWCDPCRDEAPHLAAAHDRFGDRVQFLGVDILDARESARDFMREHDWNYPSLYDPPGRIRDGLGLLGQPVTLFYDAAGDLVDRWLGPIPQAELEGRLERLLAG